MRIIGVVPGAKLFGSEDLYADQYLFVNGYPKRILANGGTPVGILSSDGYAAEDSLSLCDAFVFCGGARFYPYHFQVMEYAAKSGKPVLGICLGMQMMNTYFLVAEEAERRGWDGPLLALFNTDPAVIASGLVRVRHNMPLYVLFCMQDTFVGQPRGVGYSLLPTITSLSGICLLRVVWLYTAFAASPTLDTLYLSYPVSWAATLFALVVCYAVVVRKMPRA